jgi:hypothetical protein
VAINKDYLAVGAIGSSVQGADSGRVYVYSTSTYALDGDIYPSDGVASAKFGYSVAIFQGKDQFSTPESELPEWLSVGAPGGNKVYVYLKSSPASTWVVSDTVYSPENGATEFGRSVSWHTDYMVMCSVLHIVRASCIPSLWMHQIVFAFY